MTYNEITEAIYEEKQINLSRNQKIVLKIIGNLEDRGGLGDEWIRLTKKFKTIYLKHG